MSKEYDYDIALSFAGEDRLYVEKVAEFLKTKNIRVFYDQFEEARVWGRDLVAYFDDIYQNRASYCVIFISEHYAPKAWPKMERKSAFARALSDDGYILPVKFDNTEIPGLPPTVHYINLTQKTPAQLGELIVQKLKKLPISQAIASGNSSFRRPKVAKAFDPYKESQNWIDYLISELEKRTKDSEISFTNFFRDSKQCLRFVISGKPIYSINVQLGGFHCDHGLTFSYARGEMQMTSGYNASAEFEWDKERECIVLKLNDFSAFSGGRAEQNFTQKEFLEYIWGKICDASEGKY
jgi:hypothetical protein